MVSTTIVSHYLNAAGIQNQWLDVRNYIKTDANYRDANVNWEYTQKLISKINRKNRYLLPKDLLVQMKITLPPL